MVLCNNIQWIDVNRILLYFFTPWIIAKYLAAWSGSDTSMLWL